MKEKHWLDSEEISYIKQVDKRKKLSFWYDWIFILFLSCITNL
jgi:hypothetical protein